MLIYIGATKYKWFSTLKQLDSDQVNFWLPNANRNFKTIHDDIIFEIELIKQIDASIDYILILIEKYKDSNCKDKSILTTVDKAINSSIEHRNNKEHIEHFIEQVNVSIEVGDDWQKFVQARKEEDILTILMGNNSNQRRLTVY